MQFQVPQFIEVEDKIFGPLTFKQFAYLIGGAGACYIIWSMFPHFVAVLLIIPIGGFALALAFYSVNGRPFIAVAESALKYLFSGKLYKWKREEKKKPMAGTGAKPAETTQIVVPKLTEGKLKDIAWSLDIKENIKR